MKKEYAVIIALAAVLFVNMNSVKADVYIDGIDPSAACYTYLAPSSVDELKTILENPDRYIIHYRGEGSRKSLIVVIAIIMFVCFSFLIPACGGYD